MYIYCAVHTKSHIGLSHAQNFHICPIVESHTHNMRHFYLFDKTRTKIQLIIPYYLLTS